MGRVRGVKFSIWPNSGRSWNELAATARFADAGEWHGLWVADHYMPNTDSVARHDGPMHEVWALLPAIAAITSRIRLGPLVAPTSVHHPALLANRAASIDLISGGRFVLGLGAGWQINEHDAYGIPLGTPGERVGRFEEAIQIVRSLLDHERTDFAGRFFTITDAPMNPKPAQAKLPILVGSGGPRMMRIVARHADEWNTWGDPAMVADRVGEIERACTEVGRDPLTLRRSAQALFFLCDDEASAAALRDKVPAERSVVGTAGELVDIIGAYQTLGIDELIVPDFTLGHEQAEREDKLSRIWSEVLAGFAS